MATCEPSDGGAITYLFRCCECCGGQANEHPVRHIEHGTRSACVDVEIADADRPSARPPGRIPHRLPGAGLRRSCVMSVSSESDPEGGEGSAWVAGVAA
jgi:hypothetical protein